MPLLFLSNALYSTLIDWLIFKGEQFNWFVWISHSTLQNIVNSLSWSINIYLKLNYVRHLQYAASNASDVCSLLAKQALSDIDGQGQSLLIINFEQVRKSFLVWNIYFTFFLTVADFTFSLEYWRVTLLKYSRSNIHSSNKFFLLCCRLLDSYFNENVLLVSTF